ncbi:MAG TPA: DUF3616 domain-containing protein [Geminicoccaceae bacterium]|nr:DUF3616 domain-containing protein [Geminicoccaceae bacterium]
MSRTMLLGALLASAGANGAAAEARLDEVLTHWRMCEPSGAVLLEPGNFGGPFLVANDEDNAIRAYAGDGDGPPLDLAGADLDGFLGLDGKQADLEAATWLGDKVFWISSHGRNNEGERRKPRRQFFATSLKRSEIGPTLTPVGSSYTKLLDGLVALDEETLTDAIMPEVEEDARLAPEANGLNVEGLAAGADGTSLLIALRNPVSGPGRRAVLVRLANPMPNVESGEPAELDAPVSLDLGGRGVRSIEYVRSSGSYLIAAGPTGSEGAFDLYRWSGQAADAPEPVPGAERIIAELGEFRPEAMLVDDTGKHVRLLSDEGDRRVPAAAAACDGSLDANGGCRCQDLRDSGLHSFRSAVLVLD